MIDEKKIAMLNKLKVLAERGDRGEREAAQKHLERLMKKYNVQEADLSGDAIDIHWFKVSGIYEIRLLNQIAYKIAPGRKIYIHTSGRGKRTERGVECTDAEALQIQIEFDFYNRLLNEEFSLFYRAFIQKHYIYPDEDAAASVEVHSKPLTEDEIFRMSMMIQGMQDRTLCKMITDGK